MSKYKKVQAEIRQNPKRWLITGVAGFIGSNLLEMLLRLEQHVVGLDNFSTGKRHNLAEVASVLSSEQWSRFTLIEGDVCCLDDCRRACVEVDYILHQAALGSVPRSLEFPLISHASNVEGFVNMLVAARDACVQRFIFASSSSIYGDNDALPKRESAIGRPLSPYAATKLVDEIYAEVFHRCYGTPVIGLRYFNVFGPRQDPNGAYAAVIPRWFVAMLSGEPIEILGDGETSRDFCFIGNVIQANVLAATTGDETAIGRSYNIAFGGRVSLNQLFAKLRELVSPAHESPNRHPIFRPERRGDMRHSHADISLAKEFLGYTPEYSVDDGLAIAYQWYRKSVISQNP